MLFCFAVPAGQAARVANPHYSTHNTSTTTSKKAAAAAQQLASPNSAAAIDGNPFKKDLTKRRRRAKIPEEDFADGPEGLKYYDVIEGAGAEAKAGQRVAIHYDVRFRGVTLQSSRCG
jgi:FKBP-type peptidyl-prolyl cis-trans isomerase